MLLKVLDMHAHCRVYDERDPNAFDEFRLRNLETISRMVRGSGFEFNVFKSLSDSHRIDELLGEFPSAKCIWIYRNYSDVGESAIRRFPDDQRRAIREVAQGHHADDWFDEGLSEHVRDTVRRVYQPSMTDYDCACLKWWARNMIAIEKGVCQNPRVLMVSYDRLVADEAVQFDRIFDYLGLQFREDMAAFVHQRSLRKDHGRQLERQVESLCEQMMCDLDAECEGNCSA